MYVFNLCWCKLLTNKLKQYSDTWNQHKFSAEPHKNDIMQDRWTEYHLFVNRLTHQTIKMLPIYSAAQNVIRLHYNLKESIMLNVFPEYLMSTLHHVMSKMHPLTFPSPFCKRLQPIMKQLNNRERCWISCISSCQVADKKKNKTHNTVNHWQNWHTSADQTTQPIRPSPDRLLENIVTNREKAAF